MNRPSGYSCHFHKQGLALVEPFLIVFLNDIGILAEFHFYQMNNLVGTADDQIYLSTFPGVVFLWDKTLG